MIRKQKHRNQIKSNRGRKAKPTRQPQDRCLNDVYSRVFQMVERRIVEQTGRGVVCFISNSSWLDGLSFPAMRERYLEVFDQIWIDHLNGDKFKTGKRTPDGQPDPSIFSTEWNREGIQVGTAIATLVRKDNHTPTDTVHYRMLRGTGKHKELARDARHPADRMCQQLVPEPVFGLPFTQTQYHGGYIRWPNLPDLFPVSFPGVRTSRDDVVVDIDRDVLDARMRTYVDPTRTDAEIERIMPGAMESTARFDTPATRRYLVQRGDQPECIIRYAHRPFDVRWLSWDPETKLLDEKREEYVYHSPPSRFRFTSTQRNRTTSFYLPRMSQ